MYPRIKSNLAAVVAAVVAAAVAAAGESTPRWHAGRVSLSIVVGIAAAEPASNV